MTTTGSLSGDEIPKRLKIGDNNPLRLSKKEKRDLLKAYAMKYNKSKNGKKNKKVSKSVKEILNLIQKRHES